METLSLTGGSYSAAIVGHTKIGEYDAVVTCIGGRAWTTSIKQVGVEEGDPFVERVQVDDLLRQSDNNDPEEDLVGLGIRFDGETVERWSDRNDLLGETY